MKQLIIIGLIILSSSHILAQNFTSYQAEVSFGETFTDKNLSIEFIEVIEESRCPKNVTCVRAGEAKVRVAVYKDNALLEKKVLIFHASGNIDTEQNMLFSNDEIRIIGMALYPYPITSEKIPEKSYVLELKIN